MTPKPGCTHEWFLPEDITCPDCLWHEASSSNDFTPGRSVDLAKVHQAVQSAAQAVGPDPERMRLILRIARVENNWKAIKTARQMRHLLLKQRNAK